MAFNTILSGMKLTSTRLNALDRIATVTKSANQGYTNTTITNDNHLVLPVLAGASYLVELVVFYTGSQANDCRMDMTYPSGAAMSLGGIVPSTSVTATNGTAEWSAGVNDTSSPIGNPASGADFPFGGSGSAAAGNPLTAIWKGVLRVGANAGNLQVRFRKSANTDAAVDLTVLVDSYLRLTRSA